MKSTVDDLISVYRLTAKLSRTHKVKLIALLTEDITGQPVKVKKAPKKLPEATS